MGLIDSVIDTATEAFRFKDTVFYKEDSDLKEKYNALKILNEKFPNNKDIKNELFIVNKGLAGENEIAYQLKKSHLGMYVLRDVKFRYEDLTAQIDYIIITPIYIYYVECKNLIGNIKVTEKGDFIRKYTYNGKTIEQGMESPLRQVEAQREVIRKIWEKKESKFIKFLASSKFEFYRRVLVVAANKDTILDTSKAPKDIQFKVLRADALIRQLEYDYNQRKSDEYIRTRKDMEESAKGYIEISYKEDVNYYEYYKNKYCNNNSTQINDDLKERLIEFRKNRSNEMNLPAYYVFTNEELDKLVELRPKSLEELKNANILTPVKIKIHGEEIIKVINND